ncbi:MAG TPA: LacI family DNA-binding transcriptional regulator [Polyangiaceae bacterium]|nr:LacI family DNA-binding transcriptional regulator [Polyangiaceae bacterium]
MPAPTIYDIAARAGVGIATVSRVINGSRRVSDKTRKAVQKAMSDLGFRPNNAARRLAAGAPNRPRVVALMPFFTTSFYFTVCKALSRRLSAANTDLVLVDVHDQQEADRHLDRLVAERSSEGVILCSMDLSDGRRDQFETLNIPIVALDFNTAVIPHIRVDNVEGGRLLSQTLSAHGATKQALFIGTRGAHAFRDREEGFRAVCPPDSVVLETESVDVESGADMVNQLLATFPDVQGIACAGDALAVGVVQELRRLGKRVPQDIQVIGFDDQPMMDVLGLTTIQQPMEEFGTWAASAILDMIKDPSGPVPVTRVVPLRVIERETTR